MIFMLPLYPWNNQNSLYDTEKPHFFAFLEEVEQTQQQRRNYLYM